ncbi:hypothetical protein ACQP2U_42405 (plasmid) [Nocardia sp. CA-084685]|uniref:hypothetical protein n=1 Tax=Nocardia sp. CA-084685 TaxID=3239970 RepID=UPI003D96DF79
MANDEYTNKSRTLRVAVNATATRPPGRGRLWTVTAGEDDRWRVEARSEKAAADLLATNLQAFVAAYRPPQVLSFRGHVAVLSIDIGNDSAT